LQQQQNCLINYKLFTNNKKENSMFNESYRCGRWL